MLAVSVVSGTYNRLHWVTQMVHSARKSIGVGIPYEIVLVDGGSTDGTIEWAESQSDIRLIKHGELLGAVRAFNDGARASLGQYVILANDDIEFIDESIRCAIRFMEDNKHVGIGCFYQDRRGWDWHVESMPAILDGKQVSVYYGQVCIVPKWLGDKVGWWGDYLRTYGGDNELSCNVWELGYRVEPVPCACIHDFTPQDELRAINQTPTNSNHPDSAAWIAKWKKPDGKLGPVIRSHAVYLENPYPNKHLRILYAPIYEKGHAIQRAGKKGLRNALAEYGWVVEYDWVNDDNLLDGLYDQISTWRPDLILTQFHDAKELSHIDLKNIKKDFPGILWVNWNGDYHPEHLFDSNYIHLLKEFDLVGLVTTEVKKNPGYQHINWFYWQIGFEETKEYHPVLMYDVVWQANAYSQSRIDLARRLRKEYGKMLGLYGNFPKDVKPNGNTLYNFEEGAKVYYASLMAISDSQWQHATGFVSNRLFQAMDTGVLLLQQRFDGMEELLGLEDGKDLIVWDNTNELFDIIEYYRKRPDLARKIGITGRDKIRVYHSFSHRAWELFQRLSISPNYMKP